MRLDLIEHDDGRYDVLVRGRRTVLRNVTRQQALDHAAVVDGVTQVVENLADGGQVDLTRMMKRLRRPR